MMILSRTLVLFFLIFTFAHADDDLPWSEPVNGLCARLSILPPKPDDLFCRVYLELKNAMHVLGSRKIAFSPECLSVQLTDQDGRIIPPTGNAYDGLSPLWEPLLMPYDSTLKFQIGSRGSGVPQDAWRVIDLGVMRSWIIPKDNSTYYLSGTLSIPRHEGGLMNWHGTLTLPKTPVPKN